MKKIIAVASGKGGVGKTCVALNLAMALSDAGNKVCLLDADLGLANINILLGVNPELTFHDLLDNGKSLDEVKLAGPLGVEIIPGGSGIQELLDIEEENYGVVVEQFKRLDGYDYLVVDTSAGIGPSSMAFAMAAEMVIVLFTPEPTSMTDGFAFIKVIRHNNFKGEIKILPNMFSTKSMAKKGAGRIEAVARKFHSFEVQSLPAILRDKAVTNAVINQKPFLEASPSSSASKSIKEIAGWFEGSIMSGTGLKPSDYLKNVVHLANDQRLLSSINKANASLVRHGQKVKARKNGKEEPAGYDDGMENSFAPVLLRMERAILQAFEKNIQLHEKTMETITRLTQNQQPVAAAPQQKRKTVSGNKQMDAAMPDSTTAKVKTIFFDCDDFLNHTGGNGAAK